MKKLFIFVCCFALCFSLMAVTAAASELNSFDMAFSPGSFPFYFYDPGVYSVDLILNGSVVDSLGNIDLYYGMWNYSFEVDLSGYLNPCLIQLWGTGSDVDGFWMEGSALSSGGEEIEVTLRFTELQPGNSDVSAIDSTLDIFGQIGSWIIDSLGMCVTMFYNADTGSLTFLGVLGVSVLAVGVILGLVALIRRMLNFG